MEQLRVENFLVIKKAELNVSKICVIIGPQASGKSVLAKLLHLFREFFYESTPRVLRDSRAESALDLTNKMRRVLLQALSKYLPDCLEQESHFRINYVAGDFSIVVEKQEGNPLSDPAGIRFSKSYLNFLEKARIEFDSHLHILQSDVYSARQERGHALTEYIRDSPHAKSFRQALSNSIYIPASRAFFATFQKHIFSMIGSEIPLDPLIVDFGASFQVSKDEYDRLSSAFLERTDPLVQAILSGEYMYAADDDWILNPGHQVRLRHASSGQQEALPMLVVLSVWAELMQEGSSFIIEEPEAHLYPKAQKDIVSLFGLINNQRQLDFFITTHSPYILAALNNLILAGEVKDTVGPEALAAVIDPDYTLKFSDVSAYTIRDGVLHSILDEEEQLIGINAIDGVSDEFGREFEALLELRETGEKGAYSG